MNDPSFWAPPWVPTLVARPRPARDCLYLSDLHLGAGASQRERERDLLHLLEGLPGRVDTLVFGGDLFEFWWEWDAAVPRRHMDVLFALRKASDAGVRLRFVAGNHDFAIGRFLAEFLAADVDQDGFCLDLDGDRWLLLHGDGMARSDRLDRLVRRVLRSRAARKAWNLLPPDVAFGLAGAVGGTTRKLNPGPPPNIGQYGEAVAAWIARWNLAGVVHGHTHRPLLAPVGSGCHVNNGDWLNWRHAVWIRPGRNVRLVDCSKEGHPWLSST